MPAIIFECLVPPADSDDLARAFAARLGQLEAEGKISNADVIVSDAPADDQLLEQWERENPDEPVGARRADPAKPCAAGRDFRLTRRAPAGF